MKNKFISIAGDICMYIAILMLCASCIMSGMTIRQLKADLATTNEEITNLKEIIKSEREADASESDAQFRSINERLDKYQYNYEKLNKQVEDMQREPDDTEISIEVNKKNKEEATEQQTTEEITEAPTTEAVDEATTEAVITPEEESTVETASAPVEGMTYMGTWCVSAYEYTGNPTASGVMPTEWYTCAFNSAPLGATIYIPDLGYFVNEDVCGTPSRLDIYLGDVGVCEQFGLQYHDVYIVN